MRLLVVPDDAAQRLKQEEPQAIEVPLGDEMEVLIAKLMPPVTRVPTSELTEQARRNAELRYQFVSRYEMLDAAQIADRSGSRSTNRRAQASRWASAGRIFGVPVGGQALYPVFQFDQFGQPRPVVARVLGILKGLGLSPWATAIWWATATDALGWRAPADVLSEDGTAVLAAAELDARTLGR
jgi:hypothetical protein